MEIAVVSRPYSVLGCGLGLLAMKGCIFVFPPFIIIFIDPGLSWMLYGLDSLRYRSFSFTGVEQSHDGFG